MAPMAVRAARAGTGIFRLIIFPALQRKKL
jgi:hypothetical protein